LQAPFDKKGLPLPRWCIVFLCIAAVALVLYVIAAISPNAADWYNRTVGAAVRAGLAHLTSFLPFSLAEILLYLLPAVVILLGVYAYRHCNSFKKTLFLLAKLLCAFSLFFSVFVFSFGTGYHTHTLEQRLALPSREVDLAALQQTASVVITELNAAAQEVSFGEDGFSVMPYTLEEMNDKLLEAYAPVCARYAFVQSLQSRIKPVIASRAMSYTHITGVYTYFTGEANLNVYFPDYTLPFTAAHELAHQRGIAREDEANFIAFLVCSGAQDPYIRYCAYLNMYEYLANAIWRTDREAYRALQQTLDPCVRNELRAYSAFFDEFRDSVISEVSDAVNDTYLKLNGNEAGSASYGLVVRLAVAYYQ
jgi:hypothetical protein